MKPLLLIGALFVATPAFAADAAPSLFDAYVLPVIATIVSAIVGWIAAAVTKYLGIKVEESHRQALQTALTNAAALVAERGIDFAIAYVKKSVPDAVKKFGLTDADIAPKIEAKAGLLKTGA